MRYVVLAVVAVATLGCPGTRDVVIDQKAVQEHQAALESRLGKSAQTSRAAGQDVIATAKDMQTQCTADLCPIIIPYANRLTADGQIVIGEASVVDQINAEMRKLVAGLVERVDALARALEAEKLARAADAKNAAADAAYRAWLIRVAILTVVFVGVVIGFLTKDWGIPIAAIGGAVIVGIIAAIFSWLDSTVGQIVVGVVGFSVVWLVVETIIRKGDWRTALFTPFWTDLIDALKKKGNTGGGAPAVQPPSARQAGTAAAPDPV